MNSRLVIAWLLSGLLVFVHLSLATGLSYGLRFLAILEGLAALVVVVILLIRLSRRRSIGPLIPVLLALLSGGWCVRYSPYFTNLLVQRVGASQIVKDTASLCQQYRALKWQDQQKSEWQRLFPSDPRLPESLRQLHPLYVSLSESSVDLKMGGMPDDYEGLTIQGDVPQGTAIEVDWSQTWNAHEYDEDGLHKTRRVIAPGIEWRTWSAP